MEGHRRRRMMEGLWKQDLRDALAHQHTPGRRRLLGPPDTTRMLFSSLVRRLAVLFNQTPTIAHIDAASRDTMSALLASAGMWQLAISQQQNVLALREGLYRFDVIGDGDDARLLVEVVPADEVWLSAPPDDPDNPDQIYHYRLRPKPGKPEAYWWTRDVLCIKAGEEPFFRVESEDGKVDLSSEYIGGAKVGDDYPYWKDGKPILNYVLYHAERTGKLWDPYTGSELVEGSLAVAVMLTEWRHVMRDASWPQRWANNAAVVGQGPGEQGDMNVQTDPATLLNFKPINPAQPSSVGQWKPGGDPKLLLESINGYASDLVTGFADFADIKRTHASARSGYAIEVSRESQRAAQRRFEPQFSRGDIQSMEVIAALWNGVTGSSLPTSGWGIKYPGLPLSMEERRVMMEEHTLQSELGITSKPRLFAAVNGVSIDQARRELLIIEQDNAMFSPSPPAPSPSPGGGGADDDPPNDSPNEEPTP